MIIYDHASFHLLSPLTQSEKGSPGFPFYGFGMGRVVCLFPLVRGRVGVSRGYSSLLAHESRPPIHHRSLLELWPRLGTEPTFYPESETHIPRRESEVDSLLRTCLDGERAHIRAFICMCAIHATITIFYIVSLFQVLTPVVVFAVYR